MDQNIIEGNKLIAEFMGAFKCSFDAARMQMEGNPFPNFMFTCYNDDFQYHSSWDWLMPVVEKIAKSMYNDNELDEMCDTAYPRTFGMPDGLGNFMVRFNRCSLFYAETLIEATWLAVIDFIKFYNNGKN